MMHRELWLAGTLSLGLCGTGLATDYLGGIAGPYGQGRLDVTNDTVLSATVLTGTVYKTGSAKLTLADPVSSNGTLAVEVGSVKLTATNGEATLGGLSSVSATSVEAEIGADANLTVGNLNLGSTLVKMGAGTLSVLGGYIGTGIDLQAGALASVDCEQDNLPLVFASAGKTVDVTDGTIVLGGSAAAGSLVKTGAGTLTLSSLPADMTNLVVRGGTLRVQPQLANTRVCEDVSIPNASFEASSSSVADSSHSTGAYPVGWTRDNNVGGLSTSGKVGMDSKGSLWCDQADQYVPDGRLEVFLQDNCRLSVPVTIARRGRYRLSFWAHARSGYPGGLMRASLGGVTVGDVKVYQTAPFLCVLETPVIEAGTPTLAFEGHYFSGLSSRSVVFDDVKLSLIEAVPEDAGRVVVSNPGFEWSAPMQSDDIKPANAQSNLAEAGWTFNAHSGIADCFQTGMTSHDDFVFSGDAPPDGRRLAFIRTEGSVSQTLTFPADGTYELSFWVSKPTKRNVGVLQVTLDGTVVPGCEAVCPLQPFFCQQVHTVDVTAGEHTLAFTVPATAENHVLLDRVAVRRTVTTNFAEFEGAYADIEAWDASHDSDKGWVRVEDEDGVMLGGWLFRAPSGSVCGPSNYKFKGAECFENRVAVMLQSHAEISRSGIVLPEVGVYELSFMTAARGTFLGRSYEVVWNGIRLGAVTTASTQWRRMTFQIVAARAGETGTLCFRGIGTAGQSSSFIDAVTLRHLPDWVVSSANPLADGVCVELAADAKLELLYDGSVEASAVRRGGRKVFGVNRVISAETCPEWVRGPGKLEVRRTGFVAIVR